MTKKVTIVSADGHIGAQVETYREYLDPQYRDRFGDVEREYDEWMSTLGHTIQSRLTPEQYAAVDEDGRIAAGGEFGLWDPAIRLAELDREGVAGEILHAGPHCTVLPFFSIQNNPNPPDLRFAGLQAYHRWVADFIAHAPGRFVGVADPGPCHDIGRTIAELTWCAERGFRSVSLPQHAWDDDLPGVQHAYWEPIWAACEDLGLVLSVHAGWGSRQGCFQAFAASFASIMGDGGPDQQRGGTMLDSLGESKDSPLVLDMGPRRVLWQLMLGGVFDRHPKLKVAFTEVRADWLPVTLAELDHLFATKQTPLTMPPSEYFARHCFVTPSSIRRHEVELRHQIGVDHMLFGTDYPHPESTWPNTQDWIRVTFEAVPESELRAILGENAIRAYGLDQPLLDEVASRIGPDVSELMEPVAVPEARIAHWQARAGFTKPPEVTDRSVIDALFAEDLQALGA